MAARAELGKLDPGVAGNTTAGPGAVHPAAARALTALVSAVRDGDAQRAVELQGVVREMAWWSDPAVADGLPVPHDGLRVVAEGFAIFLIVFSSTWIFTEQIRRYQR